VRYSRRYREPHLDTAWAGASRPSNLIPPPPGRHPEHIVESALSTFAAPSPAPAGVMEGRPQPNLLREDDPRRPTARAMRRRVRRAEDMADGNRVTRVLVSRETEFEPPHSARRRTCDSNKSWPASRDKTSSAVTMAPDQARATDQMI
jgi:hypothetical protein